MKSILLYGLFLMSPISTNCDGIEEFLKEFFTYKNAKNVWFAPCSVGIPILVKWRKNPSGFTSLQMNLTTAFVSGLIGLAVNYDCSPPLGLSDLPEAIRRNTILIIFSEDPSNRPKEILPSTIADSVYESYAVKRAGNNILVFDSHSSLLMTWNSVDGLEILRNPQRASLTDVFIRGAISSRGNFNSNHSPENVNPNFIDDNLMKFSFVVHNYLKNIYNFNWDLQLTSLHAVHQVYATVNGSLGYSMNGSQFSLLNSGSADLGLYPAEFLSSGLDSLEYLPPLMKFRQAFVYCSRQTYLEPHILYTQFSGSVWSISFCLSLSAALVASFSMKLIYPEKSEESNESSISSSIIVVVGALAQQGLGKTYCSISLRIAHLSLLILTTLLYTFYNTGLLIHMLNPSQNEVQSFAELEDKVNIISAHDTYYNRFQLEGEYSQPSEWFYHNCQNAVSRCKVDVQFFNLSTGGEKIKNDKAAFFGYLSNIYNVLDDIMSDREKNDLREFVVHKPFLVGTFVRKNFLYKEIFFRGLLLLREAGIMFHEDAKWNAKKPDPLAEPNFVRASLYSTTVAFGVFFVGVGASFLALLFEVCTFRCKIRRTKNRLAHHRQRINF